MSECTVKKVRQHGNVINGDGTALCQDAMLPQQVDVATERVCRRVGESNREHDVLVAAVLNRRG